MGGWFEFQRVNRFYTLLIIRGEPGAGGNLPPPLPPRYWPGCDGRAINGRVRTQIKRLQEPLRWTVFHRLSGFIKRACLEPRPRPGAPPPAPVRLLNMCSAVWPSRCHNTDTVELIQADYARHFSPSCVGNRGNSAAVNSVVAPHSPLTCCDVHGLCWCFPVGD